MAVAPNSPTALTQDRVMPLRMAGHANLSVIRQKISTGDLPNVVATCSRAGSTSSNAVRAAIMRNGLATNA